MNHYWLEIDSGGRGGRIHRGNAEYATALARIDLHANATVAIKNHPYSLAELNKRLIAFSDNDLEHLFDDRGQLEIGHYLFAQTFAHWRGSMLPGENVRVTVISDDEHIRRLPWTLLARDGVFLSTAGWSLELGHAQTLDECRLPPSPRMLVAIPQPTGQPDTSAAAHIKELRALLGDADHHFARYDHLHVVLTWKALLAAVTENHYDVFYYYGHGSGDCHSSSLLFTDAPKNDTLPMTVADLAAALRRMPGGPPLLAYINCCQGDAGGVLGAGRQLLGDIPAVVTNRTVAYVDAACRQGIAFWRATLIEGMEPHKAVAALYGRLGDMGLSLGNVRWMTPVLHSRYKQWRASPPRYDSLDSRDPHWRLKLDRVSQFAQVAYQTGVMLREHKPPALAYIWYGKEGQGVDIFHQRLKVELRELLHNTVLYEVLPAWPDEVQNAHRSFSDMMLEAFQVLTLDAIPDRIRAQGRGETGRSILVYIRHTPVMAGAGVLKPVTLKSYLDWYDQVFAPLLTQANAFGLLTVSFYSTNPAKFDALLHRTVDTLELRHVVLYVLDQLERLAKKDLRDFINTHNIPLPQHRRDELLDEILKRTAGHYELTLAELQELVNRAWTVEEQEKPGDDDEDAWE